MRTAGRIAATMFVAVALLELFATCGGGDVSKVAEPASVPAKVQPAVPAPTPTPTQPAGPAAGSTPTRTPSGPAEPAPTPIKPVVPVESDDGLVTLEEMGVSVEGEQPVTAYELQPDGLRFAKPVRLTLEIAAGRPEMPVVLQLEGGELEVVPVLEYHFEADSGAATVMVAIEHFSSVIFGSGGMLQAELEDIPDQLVGIPFPVTAHVRERLVRRRPVEARGARPVDGLRSSGSFAPPCLRQRGRCA